MNFSSGLCLVPCLRTENSNAQVKHPMEGCCLFLYGPFLLAGDAFVVYTWTGKWLHQNKRARGARGARGPPRTWGKRDRWEQLVVGIGFSQALRSFRPILSIVCADEISRISFSFLVGPGIQRGCRPTNSANTGNNPEPSGRTATICDQAGTGRCRADQVTSSGKKNYR